jgi:hypothetical protein
MESLTGDTLVSSVAYDKDRNEFCVEYVNTFREEMSSHIYRPCLALDPEYDVSNFIQLNLHSLAEIAENDIFQVYDSNTDKRIGWMFPVQSLLSSEHSHSENPFFLKYAYVAFHKLLNNGSLSLTASEDNQTKCEIASTVDERCIILLLNSDNCNSIDGFDIDHYAIDLYKQNYTFSHFIKAKRPREESPERKTIRIKPLSAELHNEVFILEAYKNILPKSDLVAVARFHMLYQIVELLINRVFEYKFVEFTNKLKEDINNYFDLRDEFSDMSKEKYRINELMTSHSNIDSEKKEQCNNKCKELLDVAGKKTTDDLAKNLYAVRCMIFHDYRSIPQSKSELIDAINSSFEDVLSDVLLSFCNPSCVPTST